MKQRFIVGSIIFGLCTIGILFLFGKYFHNNFSLHIHENIVKITSMYHGVQKGESMGYKMTENIVLASLHAVENDLWEHLIKGEKWGVLEKDVLHDWVILTNSSTIYHSGFLKNAFHTGKIGDKVFAFVWRDGRIQKIHGTILAENKELIAFSANGKTEKIVVRAYTDLPLQKGDSGTPIFLNTGELVDVVHVTGDAMGKK